MPTSEPLTQEDIDLANQIAAAPLEISIGEQLARKINSSLRYLRKMGYVTAVKTHIAHNSADSRWCYTRTDKPLP